MRTVVITGSARGFGFELAKEFKRNNYNVVISDINEERLVEAEGVLRRAPGAGGVLAVVADVTSYENLEQLWKMTTKKFVSIDVWINNAGVNQPDKAIYEMTKEEVDFVLDVDLKGAISGSQVAYKNMLKQGFGQIYNVEGYGSNDAMMKGLSIYGTSKRAITYFTRALAKESKTLKSNVLVCSALQMTLSHKSLPTTSHPAQGKSPHPSEMTFFTTPPSSVRFSIRRY